MKRYKLLKDLPTFKAGKEFLLDDGKIVERVADGIYRTIYSKEELEKYPTILTDWFKEIPEFGLSGQYIPEDGKACWTIDCFRLPVAEPVEQGSYYAKGYAEVGLSFRSEEECQEGIEWLKAYQILRRDTKGFKPRKSSGRFYTVYWDVYDRKLRFDYYTSNLGGAKQYSPLVFAIREDAEASLEKHEREWRIYLGVEE